MPSWVRLWLILAGVIIASLAFAAETVNLRLTTPTGSFSLEAEVADDAAERARGLQFRTDFGPGDAMIFIHEKERRLSFWMKDTPTSLDILFFDAEGRWINTHHSTKPYSLKNLRSERPALYALEIAAGQAARLGLGAGSRLYIDK